MVRTTKEYNFPPPEGGIAAIAELIPIENKEGSPERDHSSDPVGVRALIGLGYVYGEYKAAKRGVFRNCDMCCKCSTTEYFKETLENMEK